MKSKYIVLLCALIYLILSIASASDGGDFDVYLDAAEKLKNGQNIYDSPFIRGLQYFYSPFFALLLIPFSSNFFITELVWLLLSAFFLYRSWILIKDYFDLSFFSNKELTIWVCISFFFIIRFLLYNISLIQITMFLLWSILESIQLIKNRKFLAGALLLALAINIKIMPLVTLPYLIYRGFFKASFYVLVFSIMFLFLPSFFIGHEFNAFLLSEWWATIDPSQGTHMIEPGRNAQSLVGLIPVFITETQGELPYNRNFIDLSVATTEIITNGVRLLLVILTLVFLKSPFTDTVDKLSEIRAISYILLIVPLIFPHQQKYAFLFIFPMMAYLSYYCLIRWKYDRDRRFKMYLSLLILNSIIFTPLIGSDLIGKDLYDAMHHFRFLGICSLFLIVFALIANEKKIKKHLPKLHSDSEL